MSAYIKRAFLLVNSECVDTILNISRNNYSFDVANCPDGWTYMSVDKEGMDALYKLYGTPKFVSEFTKSSVKIKEHYKLLTNSIGITKLHCIYNGKKYDFNPGDDEYDKDALDSAYERNFFEGKIPVKEYYSAILGREDGYIIGGCWIKGNNVIYKYNENDFVNNIASVKDKIEEIVGCKLVEVTEGYDYKIIQSNDKRYLDAVMNYTKQDRVKLWGVYARESFTEEFLHNYYDGRWNKQKRIEKMDKKYSEYFLNKKGELRK